MNGLDPPKPKLRWYQFNLRSLIIVVLPASAVFFALWSYFGDSMIATAWAVPLIYYAMALRVTLGPLWAAPAGSQQRSQTTAPARVRTPIPVRVLAVVFGGLGGPLLAVVMALLFGVGVGGSIEITPMPIVLGLIGGATIGVSFAGVVALLCGFTLGRHYSWVFGAAIGWLSFPAIGWLVTALMADAVSYHWVALLILPITVAGILIVTMILARSAAGFSRWSRRCAGIGTIIALPLGVLCMHRLLGWEAIHGDEESVEFGLGIMCVAGVGGIIGAACGGLLDRRQAGV